MAMLLFRKSELLPLEIPLILNKILNNLSIKELKNCRLVSKLWSDEVIKTDKWKHSVTVICYHKKSSTGFFEFLETVSNRNFASCYQIYDEILPTSFFEICGDFVLNLSINRLPFDDAKKFRHVVYDALLFPNMHTLTLCSNYGPTKMVPEPTEFSVLPFPENWKVKSFTFEQVRRFLSISWYELLSRFPSLEALSLTDMLDLRGLCSALKVIRQHDPARMNLKHLLVTMESDEYEDRLNPYDCFPLANQGILENLQEMRLRGSGFSSFEYLKFTPNLKKCVLELDEISDMMRDTNLVNMRGVSLQQCRELKLYCDGLTLEIMTPLMGWFPCVESVEMPMDNAIFALVCQHWSNLVFLNYRNSDGKLNDSGLTGYDIHDVKRIDEGGDTCAWRPITVRNANITCLKNLQCYYTEETIYGSGFCAAACGFEKLSRLKNMKAIRKPDRRGDKLARNWRKLVKRCPEIADPFKQQFL